MLPTVCTRQQPSRSMSSRRFQAILHPRGIAQRIGIQEGVSIAGGPPMIDVTVRKAGQQAPLIFLARHDASRHHKRAKQHTIRGVAQTRGNHPAVTGTHCTGGPIFTANETYTCPPARCIRTAVRATLPDGSAARTDSAPKHSAKSVRKQTAGGIFRKHILKRVDRIFSFIRLFILTYKSD